MPLTDGLKKTDMDVNALLEQLRSGCEGTPNSRKYSDAIDYAKMMWNKGQGNYVSNLGKIGFTGGKRALDVGSGSGHWVLSLAELNDFAHGIDINVEYTWISKIIAANHPFGQKAIFKHSRAEKVDYPDNYFDFIICHSVMMFTDHDKICNEFYRLLKPGGKLYIGYSGFGWYLKYFLVDGVIKGENKRLSSLDTIMDSYRYQCGLSTHNRRWLGLPSTTLKNLLASKGFVNFTQPGIQDSESSFLGIEATYDLLVEKPLTTTEDSCQSMLDKNASEIATSIESCINKGDTSQALSLLSHPELKFDNARTHSLLSARAFIKDGALQNAQRMLSLVKDNEADVCLVRGVFLHSAGHSADALHHYQKAITEQNLEMVRFLVSLCLIDIAQFDEARKMLEESLKKDANSLQTWFGLLKVALGTTQLPEIKSVANRFLACLKELHPEAKSEINDTLMLLK